jgi:hypothetical protein
LKELWSNATCFKFRIGKFLSAVCQIVFGLKQKDFSSLFAINSASFYAIKEDPAKEERLEFNTIKVLLASLWFMDTIELY